MAKRKKLPRSMQRRQAFSVRKSDRYSEHGRQQERNVQTLLEKMKTEEKIVDWEYFEPHSKEDSEGKDFSVTNVVDGEQKTIFFGITISPNKMQIVELKYPTIPQMHFPLNMTPERMEYRILQLFEKD